MTLPDLPIPTLADHVADLALSLPPNFPIQNIDPFGRFGTLMALAAQAGIDARVFLASMLGVGFPTEATGDYLDLHAQAVSLTRIQAGHTFGFVRFVTPGIGTVPAGTIVQTDGDGTELRYRVTEDTPISSPSSLVPVMSEGVGTVYNVGTGRIGTLVTLLPFVESVTNDADWITQAGVDQETDALLRERIRLRWPASGTGTTYHAYILQAREVPGLVKVRVMDNHPRGQGTVDVIVAPVSGAPTDAQISAAQLLADARRPVTADVLVRPPTLQPVALAVQLYPLPGVTTSLAAWQARIQAVIDAVGIGETLYPSSITRALLATGELRGLQFAQDDAPIAPLSPTHLITSGVIGVTLS